MTEGPAFPLGCLSVLSRSWLNVFTSFIKCFDVQVVETDIPALHPIDYDKINALKKLMVMLGRSEPAILIFPGCVVRWS
jgi:hypothetical protein